jgi:hypothetical protein
LTVGQLIIDIALVVIAGAYGYIVGYNQGLKEGLMITSRILARGVSHTLDMLQVPHKPPDDT